MVEQAGSRDETKLRIPISVRIGVTGHRTLTKERQLRARVRGVLRDLDRRLRHTPHTFVVLSPLAEGADRLVAEEVLAWRVSPGGDAPSLEVALPLAENDYVQDFQTQESKNQFYKLFTRARSAVTLPPSASRDAAYEQVGRYEVDHCQVLIALWDGQPAAGQGGTAEIVEYARQNGRALVWINAASGKREDDKEAAGILESFAQLDAYNNERVSPTEVSAAMEASYASLAEQAVRAGLDPALLEPWRGNLLRHFARADVLAKRYQSRYTKAGSAIYLLAAAAVAVVAVQTLFLAQNLQIVLLEVGAMCAVLFLLAASHRGEWHRKWADYRFLTERLRVASFLGLVGLNCELSEASSATSPYYESDDPMVIAFNWIWGQRPQTGSLCEDIPFEPMKRFLLSAWLNDQLAFYANTSRKHQRRFNWLLWGGYAMFLLTLVASSLHASGFGHAWATGMYASPVVLVAASLILPAVGAALAGIRSHREYQRHSDRYRKMARHLSRITRRFEALQDIKGLPALLAKANEVMLNEHQDWRLTVVIHTPEP